MRLGSDGQRAGIIAFQNEAYYYLLSVARVAGRSVVQSSHAERPGAWKSLAADQDGRILSTAVAREFVGTMPASTQPLLRGDVMREACHLEARDDEAFV